MLVGKAQQLRATITVSADVPGRVVIEATNGGPRRIWSFRNSHAGVLELGNRFRAVKFFDAAGAEISSRKVAAGQFEATAPAKTFRCEVDLSPPSRAADAARVSWLSEKRGLLMLADLLPLASQSSIRVIGNAAIADHSASPQQQVTVRLNLPNGWSAYSNEGRNVSGEFEVADTDASVVVVGEHLRASQTAVSGMGLTLITDGDWAFADSDALELAAAVLKFHRNVFGAMPSKQAGFILLHFPQAASSDKWSAETRGSTVTLLLGKQGSKAAALAQLSVPVTHEFFHLWVPNGLALEGEYDWFYEGFTIYEAAGAAVHLGLMTFQDFLNAFSRAYDAYAARSNREQWSLIDASQRRWTGGESAVYQESMLVAFLYDLKLRTESRGKRSLDDVYRELFRQHALAAHDPHVATTEVDGNGAVIKLLASQAGMQQFTDSFIRRPAVINLEVTLAPFGLRVQQMGRRTYVYVNDSLTRAQRDLLRELGYNDLVRPARQKDK